jgi:hypothetical protein
MDDGKSQAALGAQMTVLSQRISAELAPVMRRYIDGKLFTHAALILALSREIGAVIYAGEGTNKQFRAPLEKLARDHLASMSVVADVIDMEARATQPTTDRRQ